MEEKTEVPEEKKKSKSVTAKTLKAWLEQTRRIIKQDLIVEKGDVLKLSKIAEDIKKEWLKKIF